MYTKHELALLAILVGGLSGLGMYWGYRDVGFLAGLVAALFAMSGIVAARVYILQKLFNTDEGPAELFVSAVFATGWWGILIVGVAMFIAFKVGTTGPDVFDDD
ncbi:MAG: hypothetical protein DHS20C16_06630 [Phycisphaerae bacterium]|nr:MAG: hypothetical protein DHS20C16_06630 [Phycisphaerae bacterium]